MQTAIQGQQKWQRHPSCYPPAFRDLMTWWLIAPLVLIAPGGVQVFGGEPAVVTPMVEISAGPFINGRIFPWGNEFDPARLNSTDKGPYDTVPVGSYPSGKSPYGLYDMAGQVFEWTSTPDDRHPERIIVKGGSWDDYPGVTRAAARHSRPATLKHILIGFRCAGDLR